MNRVLLSFCGFIIALLWKQDFSIYPKTQPSLAEELDGVWAKQPQWPFRCVGSVQWVPCGQWYGSTLSFWHFRVSSTIGHPQSVHWIVVIVHMTALLLESLVSTSKLPIFVNSWIEKLTIVIITSIWGKTRVFCSNAPLSASIIRLLQLLWLRYLLTEWG